MPPLKPVDGIGGASPTNPQHDRQKFVREMDVVLAHAVLAHQQPPCQALLDVAGGIRRGSAGDLIVDGAGVAQEEGLESGATSTERLDAAGRRSESPMITKSGLVWALSRG